MGNSKHSGQSFGSVRLRSNSQQRLFSAGRGRKALGRRSVLILPRIARRVERYYHPHLLTHTPGSRASPAFHTSSISKPGSTGRQEIIELTQAGIGVTPAASMHMTTPAMVILGVHHRNGSGEKYADYIQHTSSIPGDESSGYERQRTLIPKRAAGYSRGKDHLQTHVQSHDRARTRRLALYHVDDIHLDQRFNGAKLLSLRRCKRCLRLRPWYGFGWVIANQFGHRHIVHAGASTVHHPIDRYPRTN